jgi:hypothetical protein
VGTQTTKFNDGQGQDSGHVQVKVVLDITGDASGHPLTVIEGIAAGIASLETPLRGAVHDARRLRHTWEEIGAALGVTRQSAWERFATD